MKHPIAYRIAFYSILLAVCCANLFLISLMKEAPYKSNDMAFAYLQGCTFGLVKSLINSDRCGRTADEFKSTLDDLDVQMEAYEKRKR